MNIANTKDNVSALQKISKMIEGTGKKIDLNYPAVEIKDYTKIFKKFVATKDVTFTVGHGVIHGFIGPNGAGKTSTIKAMIGAYIVDHGKISINGHKAGSEKANSLIGYIPERASFPKHLNTIDYLTAMAELSGISNKVAKQRADDIIKALNLDTHAKRKPNTFSSGMQKKILLAQSLLTDPKILILDEPAANLDPTARKELFDQLIMLRDQGKTIIISSHILAELERIVEETTFIYYGKIIFSGKISEFTHSDSQVYIRADKNDELTKWLDAKKISYAGDLKNEVEIHHLSREKIHELFMELGKAKLFTVLSFRSNDLQSLYDRLLETSKNENSGEQNLNGKVLSAQLRKQRRASKMKGSK